MTRRSSLGGAFEPLTSVRWLPANMPLTMTDPNGAEWVRAGTLAAYNSTKHAALFATAPGLTARALPARSNTVPGRAYVPGGGYSTRGGKLLGGFVSNFNLFATGNTGNAFADVSDNTVTYSNPGLNAAIAGIVLRGAFLHAGSNNLALFGIGGNGLYISTGVAAPTAVSGVGSGMGAGAGGKASLSVVCSSATASQFYTSTDGATWTPRTASGGGSGVVGSAHYAPCSGHYLFVRGNGSQLDRATDGFTLSACTLPANTAFIDGDSFERRYAASPTASLFLLSDGRLLRTTDCVNFTAIDLTTGNLRAPDTNAQIVYDVPGARFIIWRGQAASGEPMFYFSTDNGLTWQESTAFEEFDRAPGAGVLTALMGPARIAGANRTVMVVGIDINAQAVIDITALDMRNPTHVGSWRGLVNTSLGLTLHGFLKVKA